MSAEDRKPDAQDPASPGETAPSMRIGRYAVVRELGRGGMGIVYEATDPAIGRRIAIKVINVQFLAGAGEAQVLRERLFREAHSAGALSHSGIVVVYDVGEDREMAFIAMEYVDGPSLQQVLQSGRKLQPAEAMDILRQVAAALDYAHSNGVVHRDIKPPNIMLHKGRQVKIADFGIAKVTTAPKYTATGMVMGTPAYMSPEQIEGREVDGRSDQFSLAVVAYELLTGASPFTGGSYASMVHSIVYGQRPSAHVANPLLSAAVDPVFARALASSPEYRFATCTEFVSALDTALHAAVPVSAPIATPVVMPMTTPLATPAAAQPLPAPPARGVRWVLVAFAMVLALALGGAVVYKFWPALQGLVGGQAQGVRPSVPNPAQSKATEAPAPSFPPPAAPTGKDGKPPAPAAQADLHSPAAKEVVPNAVAHREPGQIPGAKSITATRETSAHAVQTPVRSATDIAREQAEVVPAIKKGIIVSATRRWTDTGIDLRPGDTLDVEAHGLIRVSANLRIPAQDPGGYRPGCARARLMFGQPADVAAVPAPTLSCWSLIGRVGGTIFEVGAQSTVPEGSAGRLYLGVNDDDLRDNSGTWTAVVSVLRH
jgi:serine/threonine-protein kinase